MPNSSPFISGSPFIGVALAVQSVGAFWAVPARTQQTTLFAVPVADLHIIGTLGLQVFQLIAELLLDVGPHCGCNASSGHTCPSLPIPTSLHGKWRFSRSEAAVLYLRQLLRHFVGKSKAIAQHGNAHVNPLCPFSVNSHCILLSCGGQDLLDGYFARSRDGLILIEETI